MQLKVTAEAVGTTDLARIRVGDQIDFRFVMSDLPPGLIVPPNADLRLWATDVFSGKADFGQFNWTMMDAGDPNQRLLRATVLKIGQWKFQGTWWNNTDDASHSNGKNQFTVFRPKESFVITELPFDDTPGPLGGKRLGVLRNGVPSEEPIFVI